MLRSTAVSVLATLMLTAVPVSAAERTDLAPVAPSAAVAEAWAKESGGSSKALRTLYATYGVVQGLEMASTMTARRRGAVEANPVMQGSYGKGIAVKAAMSAVTMLAVHGIGKKSKKAAVITMIAMNVGTAVVIANNMRNAGRLK